MAACWARHVGPGLLKDQIRAQRRRLGVVPAGLSISKSSKLCCCGAVPGIPAATGPAGPAAVGRTGPGRVAAS